MAEKEILLGSVEDEMAELKEYIEILAECSTTSETLGAARDEAFDQIIYACRVYINRKDKT